MKIDWTPLDRAMEGRNPVFWWRDDDVIAPSDPLDRLLAMAATIGAPLTLASIPSKMVPTLPARIATADNVNIAVHGWAHQSHAPKGEKNAEFGAHRPLEQRVEEARNGLRLIHDLFSDHTVPAFIPPWNRMDLEITPELADMGYRGISLYGERNPKALPLVRFDAHLDPIDWRGSRSVVDPAALIRRTIDLLSDDVPIGLMTHHLVHDAAIWDFVEAFTARLTMRGAQWVSFASLIAQSEAPTA